MKKKVKEESDVNEFVEEESLPEEHSEPVCMVWECVIIAALVEVASDNGNVGTEAVYYGSHLVDALVVADAVGYGKEGFSFTRISCHRAKIVKLPCRTILSTDQRDDEATAFLNSMTTFVSSSICFCCDSICDCCSCIPLMRTALSLS